MDGPHVPDLPPRPPGRAAGGRPRDPQGGPGPLRARRAPHARPSSSGSPSRGARTARWRASTSGARWTTQPAGSSRSPRRSMNATCAGLSFSRRLLEPEPPGAVHLRERLHPARARRPLHLERRCSRSRRRRGRPRRPSAVTTLPLLCRAVPRSAQRPRRQRRARLLLELAARARLRVLVVAVLPLRDRPRAGVLAAAQNGPPGCTSSTSGSPPVQADRAGCPRAAPGGRSGDRSRSWALRPRRGRRSRSRRRRRRWGSRPRSPEPWKLSVKSTVEPST